MRYVFALAVLLSAQISAAWAVGDPDTARPGGAFSTVAAETAAACERLCADDTLCMAWSFGNNLCELKAIVPAAIAQQGVISGVSLRAPSFMRGRLEPPQAARAPSVADEADATPAMPEDDVSFALLGGPDQTEPLRSRLGN